LRDLGRGNVPAENACQEIQEIKDNSDSGHGEIRQIKAGGDFHQ